MSDNWEYETKCRRCGHITGWHFSTKEHTDISDFHRAVSGMIAYTRSCECKKCKKRTVQDIVSYN